MRRIVHLSDLHFGRVNVDVVAPLVERVRELAPDLTVLSGDFVQNGTRPEFEQAQQFVGQMPRPWLAVPGNHDMPFLNIAARAAIRLGLYKRYITSDLRPFYEDDEIAVLGVSTSRVLPLRGGRISEWQIRDVEQRLCTVAAGKTKILVTHHPFDLAETYHHNELVGRARQAMGRFAQSIDLMLAGHMHVSHSGHTAVRYKLKGRSAIFVQAGTATSTRGRGEPNAFNVIRIDRPEIVVERHAWNHQDRFECECTDRFDLPLTSDACATVPRPVDEEEPADIVYPDA